MSGLPAGLTAALARSCAELRFDTLGDEVVDTACMAFADCVACMLAGARAASVHPVLEVARAESGTQESSIVGWPDRLAPSAAALVNGASAHALDYDDVGIAMLGHPSAVLVPAILALAEAEGASGRDVVCAYVAGFEVAAILGRIVNPAHYAAGWHTTCTLGTVAAAAAASRLFGLDAVRTEAAIGISASHAGGLRSNFGSDVKPLHAGMAARAGVISAQLARAGLGASPGVLEAKNGFLQTVGGIDRIPTETRGFPGLDGRFELVTSGVSFKLHACCGTAHSAIDSALRLARSGEFDLAEVVEVTCDVNRMAPDILIYHEAKSALQARFSLEYCIAVALLDQACGLPQFAEGRIAAQDVQTLMKRVRMRADPDLPLTRGGLTAARVTVRTPDGEWTDSTEIALGSPEVPAPRALLYAKFRECAEPLIGPDAATQLFGDLSSLQNLEDVASLAAACRVSRLPVCGSAPA